MHSIWAMDAKTHSLVRSIRQLDNEAHCNVPVL